MVRWTRSRTILPGRPADGAATAVAQHAEWIEPGVVAVAPGGCDGIRADQMDVHEARLVGRERRRGIEPARQAGLAPAIRARTQPAELLRAIDRLVAVLPLDLEGAGGAIGVDLRGSRRARISFAGVGVEGHPAIVRHR